MAFKHLLPFVIKKQFNKNGGDFFGGQNPFGNQQEQSEDKTIKVDYAPESENDRKTDGLGDYIEYEGVDE